MKKSKLLRSAISLLAFAAIWQSSAMAANLPGPSQAQTPPSDSTTLEAENTPNESLSLGEQNRSEIQNSNEPRLNLDLYGSWRFQFNLARVDNAAAGQDNSYLGVSDAYSRVGGAVSADIGRTKITGVLELGLNTADLKLGDPAFFDDQDLRRKSIKASGNWGTLLAGKDWLPYYNTVGYPVDYFSSLYAGYSTYAFFRENQIAYTTPNFRGANATIARIKRTSGGPSGWHYTAQYKTGAFTFGAGMEDMDNAVPDTYGASVSYTSGPYYGALKYENQDGRGAIYNAFGQVKDGKLTYKFGVGLGDQYAGNSYHTGLDYQISDALKVFAEYYREQDNYAILADGAKTASDYLGRGGFGARQNGRSFVLGFRTDF